MFVHVCLFVLLLLLPLCSWSAGEADETRAWLETVSSTLNETFFRELKPWHLMFHYGGMLGNSFERPRYLNSKSEPATA